MIQNLRDATPPEIDAELYRLSIEDAKAQAAIDGTLESIHDLAKSTKRQYGRRPVRTMTDTAAILAAASIADDPTAYEQARAIRILAKLTVARAMLAQVEDEMAPFNAEFKRRGGWERAFLVITNGKGHVHSSNGWTSARCSTCRPTTQYRWITALSGKSREEIIDAIGEDACSTCYKGAPAKPRTVFTAEELEQREAAKVEREAKAAKKALTGITNPDGTELRDSHRGVIKSEVTAQNEYFKALDYADGLDRDATEETNTEYLAHWARLAAEYREHAERYLAALAAKRHPGLDLDEAIKAEREALAPKAAKRKSRGDREWNAMAHVRAANRARNR